MPEAPHSAQPRPARRRADAERSIARILDAAVDALGRDPDSSMAHIARRAGVVRATIYVHFPTRDALLDAVTDRTLAEVNAVIAAVDPDRGDPTDALARVVGAAWQTLGRYQGIIALNTRRDAHDELRARHASVFAMLEPLIRRGQADGSFRPDVPAGWHLTTFMALVHAASEELRAGRLADSDAAAALVASVLGAVSSDGRPG